MAKWKVFNDNIYPFTQTFKGKHYHIQAGGYELFDDYDEAHQFRVSYTPIIEAADGTHDPRGFKKLRIVQDGEAETKGVEFVSPIDGKKFSSEQEMNAYLKANYADQVFKDDALEEEILKKRGPGRPKGS